LEFVDLSGTLRGEENLGQEENENEKMWAPSFYLTGLLHNLSFALRYIF
jgi:hypothetical protein